MIPVCGISWNLNNALGTVSACGTGSTNGDDLLQDDTVQKLDIQH